MLRILPLALLLTAIVGCGSNAAPPAAAPADAAPASAPVTATAPVTGDNISGKVLELLPAAPYVYLRIEAAQGEIWAAVPDAQLEVGANVTIYSPMTMTRFESKSLQRTFDLVYFGTLSEPGSASAGGGNPHAGLSQPAAVEVGTVEKAVAADARTVAEAWAEGAGLDGKTITVRGKVVKYNPGVMGKNWIHLQDGSGDAAKGTNDLTVTSLDAVEKGQTVTITGTVHLNKDFGAGYRYPLIVEEAKVLKDL